MLSAILILAIAELLSFSVMPEQARTPLGRSVDGSWIEAEYEPDDSDSDGMMLYQENLATNNAELCVQDTWLQEKCWPVVR